MRLYLVRHGANRGRENMICTPPVSDFLTPEGREQATNLGAALSTVHFDAVYSSPLGRAIETAQYLVDTETKIKIEPWLIEWRPSHVLEGTGQPDPANYERMQAEAAALRPEMSWKTHLGEGALEMAQRVILGILNLLQKHGVYAGHGGYLLENPDDNSNIALVAHGGSLGSLLGFLLGIPIKPFMPIAFEQTGVAIVEFVKRMDVWYPSLCVSAPVSRPVCIDTKI